MSLFRRFVRVPGEGKIKLLHPKEGEVLLDLVDVSAKGLFVELLAHHPVFTEGEELEAVVLTQDGREMSDKVRVVRCSEQGLALEFI